MILETTLLILNAIILLWLIYTYISKKTDVKAKLKAIWSIIKAQEYTSVTYHNKTNTYAIHTSEDINISIEHLTILDQAISQKIDSEAGNAIEELLKD